MADDDDEMGSCGWVTTTTRTPLEKRDASTSEHLDSDLILPRFVTTLCIILLRKGGIRRLWLCCTGQDLCYKVDIRSLKL